MLHFSHSFSMRVLLGLGLLAAAGPLAPAAYPGVIGGLPAALPAQQAQPETSVPGAISNYAGNGYGAGEVDGGYYGDNGPATLAELNQPSGIAMDKAGNLYIADTLNNRIRRVDHTTGVITTVAGNGLLLGSCSYSLDNLCGDGGPATSANLFYPGGVAFDAAGNMYIADSGNNAIRKVSTNGIISTVAGRGLLDGGFTGDGGQAAQAHVNNPNGVAVDAAGDLYIADTGNNRIRMVSAKTGIIETVAGGGSGCAGIGSPIGDGCPATDAKLADPTEIGFDAAGRLYIVDNGNNLIRAVNAQQVISTFAGGTQDEVCATATDPEGDGCPATEALLDNPHGLAFDQFGALYVSDSLDERVRRIDAATLVIASVAGDGNEGFTGTGNPATQAELNYPYGIAFDAAGNLYFADLGNQVIREVTYLAPPAATPTFSPAPGVFKAALRVGLADADKGATIYYTTNGDTPTTSSPQYIGTIPVTETTTIKAIAKSANAKYALSAVASGTFSIVTPTATTLATSANPVTVEKTVTFTATVKPVSGIGVPTGSVEFSVDGQQVWYAAIKGGKATYSTSFSSVEPHTVKAVYSGDALDYTSSGTLTQNVAYIGLTPAPTITPATGSYNVQQTVLIAAKTPAGGSVPAIYYTTDGTTPTTNSNRFYGSFVVNKSETVKAFAVSFDYAPSAVVTVKYAIVAPAAPTFSPAPGSFHTVQKVTLADVTKGAVIYYTTDGTSPTRSSSRYYSALTVSTPETIKAIAVTTPYVQAGASGLFNVTLPAPTPTFSPAAGTYNTPQTVKISDTATAGLVIYYTTNGSAPTTASAKYTAAGVRVAGNETIKAIALANGTEASLVATSAYTITGAPGYSDGTIAAAGGKYGDPSFGGDGGPFANSLLKSTATLAFDGAGNLYIDEIYNDDVRKVDAKTGFITTVAGNQTQGYSGDKGLAIKAQLNLPEATAAGVGGNLFIADTGNNVVRKVSAATGIIVTVAGTGKAGNSGDGGPATKAELDAPFGVAVDAEGDLYISNTSYSVVRRVDGKTGIITTVAGTGVAGYSGDGGLAAKAKLSYPGNLALDASGNLYIADNGNNLVRVVNAATGVITTFAGHCVVQSNGSCGWGYSGDGGPASKAELDSPGGVSFDTGGNLYIADVFNNVIRRVDAKTGVITTAAGNGRGANARNFGSGGYSGNGGQAINAELDDPTGVAVNGSGVLYIADYWNDVVRRVVPVVPSGAEPGR